VSLGPFQPYARDLAPGDRGVLDASWDAFTLEALCSPDQPSFEEAFSRLWSEFAPRGEIEQREVLEQRFAWDPRRPLGDAAMLYEMLVVRRDGEIVAIRDHTAIATRSVFERTSGPDDGATEQADGSRLRAPGTDVIVHLSHVLVEPSMRGRGLASWLRALPIETARRCLELARCGPLAASGAGEPCITLVAEMEHDDGVTPAVVARLRSYAKAGFRVVDPQRVPYSQPDFRPVVEIDRTQPQPLPLCLVVRRVGREHEDTIRGAELRAIVAALHSVFAVHVRADHMEGVRALAAQLPEADERVELLTPGSVPGAGEGTGALR